MSNPIGWCDITINPVVGCSKCSPGCDHCYAERFAYRLTRNPQTAEKYAGVVDARGKWTGKVKCFHSGTNRPHTVPGKNKRVPVHRRTSFSADGEKPGTYRSPSMPRGILSLPNNSGRFRTSG